MLREEIKNIKRGNSELREFGLTIGIVLGLLGGLFLWREKDYYFYFLILSFFLIFLGIFSPTPLRPFQKAWMTLSVIIGWFMTRLILSILFYLVFTSIRILAGLSGKIFLDITFNKSDKEKRRDSYWILRKKTKFERGNYEKQF